MPEIKSQHQCVNLDDLKEAESFGEPIGELPKQMDSGFLDREDIFAGTWECEPGVLKLDLDVTEFCHILKGHWVLTSDSGQVTEVKAGDSFVFPKGWKGTAEVPFVWTPITSPMEHVIGLGPSTQLRGDLPDRDWIPDSEWLSDRSPSTTTH